MNYLPNTEMAMTDQITIEYDREQIENTEDNTTLITNTYRPEI